jgi:hypothetical protein
LEEQFWKICFCQIIGKYFMCPGRKSILGIDCYPDITSIPEKIDLGIVVTPANTVPDVVESCGKAGVEGLIIISSGFKACEELGFSVSHLPDGISMVELDLK